MPLNRHFPPQARPVVGCLTTSPVGLNWRLVAYYAQTGVLRRTALLFLENHLLLLE